MSLTQDQKLVSTERPGYAAKPGHALVVYEVTDGGPRSPRLVLNGQNFTPPWTLLKQVQYVSWAVNMNSELRYNFTRRFQHMTPGHPFDLTFVLRFCVEDPVQLVSNLVDDPLAAIRDETALVFGSAVAGMPWDDVISSKQQSNFASVWTLVHEQHSGRVMDLARKYGIDLKGVDAAFGLTTDDEKPFTEKANLLRAKSLDEIQGERESLERERQTQSELHKIQSQQRVAKSQHDLNREEQQRRNELAAIGAQETAIKATVAAYAQGIEQVAREARTATDLERTAEAVRRMAQPALVHVNDSAAGHGPLLKLLPSGNGGSEISKLLAEIVHEFGNLSDDEGSTRRHFSAALHLLAEHSLRSDANPELLRQYQTALNDNADQLTNQQYFLVQKLRNDKQMRALLS